jgi:hypothetical protein
MAKDMLRNSTRKYAAHLAGRTVDRPHLRLAATGRARWLCGAQRCDCDGLRRTLTGTKALQQESAASHEARPQDDAFAKCGTGRSPRVNAMRAGVALVR